MKRSPMPPRRRPLLSGTGGASSRRARDAFPSELRNAVWTRALGCCDWCSYPLAFRFEAHHRRLRSQGGRDELTNLLALHPACHHDVAHGAPERYVWGLLVPHGVEPSEWPVWRHRRAWEQPGEVWVPCDPHPRQCVDTKQPRP